LRLALHLEHADGVGKLQGSIYPLIFRQLCEIESFTVVLRDESEAIFEHGHHAESQKIHFDNT
jgi:hypothetical protein